MTDHASGPFDVTITPLSKGRFDRMALDKQFHGDLEAVSAGEMMAFQSAAKGSAGYVAMERVIGTLKGQRGSFVLQHSATMHRGVPEMSIAIVPDSGTDELAGISGTMRILITDGKHSYEFDYTLAGE